MKTDPSHFFRLLLAGACLAGCHGGRVEDNGKTTVVTTIFPCHDFARAICGGAANVLMLVPPGVSVHAYDPSPADLLKARKADVFVYIGGESEAWVREKLLPSLDAPGMKVVRLMDFAGAPGEEDAEEEGEEDHGEHGRDEHLWTSPKNAMLLLDAMCDGICEKDPANEALYRANAKRRRDELAALDAEFTAIVAAAGRRTLVVADKFPFAHFVKHYGLGHEAAFPGCCDQADAGARTVARLVAAVRRENIPYVYHVELGSPNVAAAVCAETGAGMLLLHSCHNIARREFDAGATYISLMRQNAANLRRGLE